jgi:uncharacterized protein YigE (DUF2233 family)
MKSQLSVLFLFGFGLIAPANAVDCKSITTPGHRSTVCRADLRADRVELYLTDAAEKPFTSFAALLRDLAGCRTALYLDGTVSNGTYLRLVTPAQAGVQ